MRTGASPRRSAGFTLLEMTVALVITGMAVAAGYAGLRVLSAARAAARDVHAGVIRAANVRAPLASTASSRPGPGRTAPSPSTG